MIYSFSVIFPARDDVTTGSSPRASTGRVSPPRSRELDLAWIHRSQFIQDARA